MGRTEKVLVIELVVLFLVIFAFDSVGKTGYGKERVAENYFVKYMNADLEGIYDDFDITESTFVNKESFVNSFEGMQPTDYEEYHIVENEDEDGFLEKTLASIKRSIEKLFRKVTDMEEEYNVESVGIDYTDAVSGNEDRIYVRLVEEDSKKFFYFRSWKVAAEDFIVQDYTIYVPDGAAVTLNGVELTQDYLRADDYGDTVYVIPQIFNGTYDLTVAKEGMEDVTVKVNTGEQSYRIDSMQLKKEYLQNAVDKASENMQLMYTAAFQDKSYSELTELSVLPGSNESVKECYEDLSERIKDDDYQDFAAEDIYPETYYYVGDDGKFYIEVTLSYDYDTVYQYENWNGVKEKRDDSGHNNTHFTYLLEGSDLQLAEVYGLSL